MTSICVYMLLTFNVQSKAATTAGNIKTGRRLGVFAVYLVVSAILFALIADIVLVGIGIAGRSSLYCSKKFLFIIIVFHALTFGLCICTCRIQLQLQLQLQLPLLRTLSWTQTHEYEIPNCIVYY